MLQQKQMTLLETTTTLTIDPNWVEQVTTLPISNNTITFRVIDNRQDKSGDYYWGENGYGKGSEINQNDVNKTSYEADLTDVLSTTTKTIGLYKSYTNSVNQNTGSEYLEGIYPIQEIELPSSNGALVLYDGNTVYDIICAYTEKTYKYCEQLENATWSCKAINIEYNGQNYDEILNLGVVDPNNQKFMHVNIAEIDWYINGIDTLQDSVTFKLCFTCVLGDKEYTVTSDTMHYFNYE